MSLPAGPYASLQLKDFRLFLASRFTVTLAIQIQSVVVGWQVYEITRDPLSLGLIGLAEAIPSIGVSLYAGHLADVMNRKRIIVACISTLLLCSAALLYFTTDVGAFILDQGVMPIYTVIFVSGIARGFISPANFSFMPQLVPRELYNNAITWNSTLWETAAIGGPALGGFLFGFFDITTAYAVDVALTVIGLFTALRVTNRPVPPESEEQGIYEKIKAGLRFVYQNKIVLSAMSLDLFAVLFGGAVALLPIFASEILFVGPQGLGILRSAPSIGALIVALYMAHRPLQRHAGAILFWCVAGFGVCMIGFGLSTNFWLSLLLLAASGGFDCISVIIRGTLLQTRTPENMKGRVAAVSHIFVGSSNEIGAFESGAVARLMGVVPSVIFGGCMTIAVVITTAWKSKSLRQLQKLE